MTCKILGVYIENIAFNEALVRIEGLVNTPGHHLVVTANPEILVHAYFHPKYKKILEKASLIIADGFGLVLASYLTKDPIKNGVIKGVDLALELIKRTKDSNLKVVLLGSDAVNKATQNIRLDWPNSRLTGLVAPNFSEESLAEYDVNKNLISEVTKENGDILLVGLGYPKQEVWINNYLEITGAKVGIGVGGSFDFWAGLVKRAPRIFRVLGVEWLWRLFVEPSRISRILVATVAFPILVAYDGILKLFHVEHE